MKAQRYANNKTEAARLAGMSRPTLYHLLRLPGAPMPKADGRWDVAAIRKFALKSAKKLEGPRERDRLQMQLLDLKIQRAARELSDYENQVRESIQAEFASRVTRNLAIFKSRFWAMPGELCGRFSNMHPNEIKKLWRSRLDELAQIVRQDIMKPDSSDEPKSNVVEFVVKQRAAAS